MNSLSYDERTQLQTRMAILESQINVLKNEAYTLKAKNEQLTRCIKKFQITEPTATPIAILIMHVFSKI